MKHLKRFESNTIGLYDYVIINTTSKNNNLKEFIDNNIGKVISNVTTTFRVTYENIPTELLSHFYIDTITNKHFVVELTSDIVAYSENEEELELKISTNKYNL